MLGLEEFLVDIGNCTRSYVTPGQGAGPYVREQGQARSTRSSEATDTDRWRISKHASEYGNKRPHPLVRYDFTTFYSSPYQLAHADLHLSTLNSSFAHSNPIVEVDGHPLIDFKYCSKIAEQIDTLVQYSPPRTRHTTRPDALAYVEYSLKSSRSDDVLRDAKERSARFADEERVFHAQRKKMLGLGFPWAPPRRRK
jgi:hypothetical protein